MRKKTKWQLRKEEKQQKIEEIKAYKEYRQEKQKEDTEKQHNDIISEVFKGKQEISNYEELQVMNNNLWKTARHINAKRQDLSSLIPTKEKEVEDILSKIQSLALTIERSNNCKGREAWEKLDYNMNEYKVLEALNAYKEIIAKSESDIVKKQAMKMYFDRMNKLCDDLMKKYNL